MKDCQHSKIASEHTPGALDVPGSDKTPHMCFRSTKWSAGKVESHGSRADESKVHADGTSEQTTASTVLDTNERDGDSTGMKSGAEMRRCDGWPGTLVGRVKGAQGRAGHSQ